MRAFISYSHHDRKRAAQIKEILERFEIPTFLAHDDILVSQQWRDEILRELEARNIFVALLSQAFKESDWAPQETGIAASHQDVLIIPLSLDETVPFGFISHLQGKKLPPLATPLSLVMGPIVERYPEELLPLVITQVRHSPGWRWSEAFMGLLEPYFSRLSDDQVHELAEAAIANSEVWLAGDCIRKYLPAFIHANRERINPDRLKVLTHQIEHQEPWET